MSGAQANPHPSSAYSGAVGTQTVSATITALGAAALAIGGIVAGAFITRALLSIGRGPTPSLVGDRGSLMIGSQDAVWTLEAADTSSTGIRRIWVVHDLPAHNFLDSSTEDFDSAEAARADLLEKGLSEGWIFDRIR